MCIECIVSQLKATESVRMNVKCTQKRKWWKNGPWSGKKMAQLVEYTSLLEGFFGVLLEMFLRVLLEVLLEVLIEVLLEVPLEVLLEMLLAMLLKYSSECSSKISLKFAFMCSFKS